LAIELFLADERVLALVESEAEEVRGLDELGRASFGEQAADVRGGRTDVLVRRCLSPVLPGVLALSVSATSRLVALFGLLEVVVLSLAPLGLGDRHAVHRDGAADEVAVTDEPAVVAALAPDGRL